MPLFAPDTVTSLESLVNLINSGATAIDGLLTPADLAEFLKRERVSGFVAGTESELRDIRQLRSRLTEIWHLKDDDAVPEINSLLRSARALPQLVKHDEWDYHIHATTPDASLVDRLSTESAMALVDVVRSGEWERLKSCASPDCHNVLVDLSRNRSKKFCDSGNCGNRENVRAYRARQAIN